EIADHFDLTFKIQIKQENRWIDHIPYNYLIKEHIYEDQLKYKFFPKFGADKLLIVFQAVNRTPGYNYIGTLSDLNAHRLYIKDDYGTDIATKSSYYLGPNKSNVIADKVIKMISEFCDILKIDLKKCVTLGSSKGGFAAIYFGLKLNVGAIFSGGPQIFLGDFLNSSKEDSVNPAILTYLAGDNSKNSVHWANNILINLLNECKNDFSGNIYIHVGIGEPHYKKHVQPFEQILKDNNISNIFLDLGNYNLHSELADHFPKYLKQHVKNILLTI
ncbi:MAG: hypothetical protein J0647_01810, partial [Campylobacteraceae bacterium]|nr:hypothetical protein [Campylobacteraceae bacterium]